MLEIDNVLFLSVFCFLFLGSKAMGTEVTSTGDITGFWKTINDKTGKSQSIVAIYTKNNMYFGRIIVTYNDDGSVGDNLNSPKERAPGVVGNPYYAGMDIIWDMKKEGSKYVDGKIIDPEKGDIYDAEMWLSQGNLVVRGEILFFGENQTWVRAKDTDFPPNFNKPDISKFIALIPQVKH